ncbi:MAG: TonB-dependent receptor [Gammaproteobacteria bacterium]|nr:TonB-dependent receptor [Gammaproteobacteria bacterium]
MQQKRLNLLSISCLASAIWAAGVESAAAQSAALEEVVVTARRRAESFQDVPVTITAFDEGDIASAGIERPQDFISLTPNVTLVETQNQGTSFITVRGISQARNSEPSVAVLVDGVLMSSPAQFTQELFDVQQIEVLKGAQGAVYGRNAIGGAIVINTREPGEEFSGRARLGYDSGPGMTAQVMGSGPLGGSDTLKYHAALSYFDTDGYIDNAYLGEEADPYRDTSARLRLLWEPSDRLRTDARLYYSEVDTQALYFTIDFAEDANNTSLPVRVNNPGMNERELGQLAFKADYDFDSGTLTSITSYDSIEEILTGDQFDNLPIEESLFFALFGDDWAQSQFLDVETLSQEVRFTSDADQRLRWIAGAYAITTDRYISTGNIVDRGLGAFPVYRTPRGAFPFDPVSYPDSFQTTFLADAQDNFAWALFGEIAYDITDSTEMSFAMRYDEDTREQTTLTPTPFLPTGLDAFFGEVREHTWDELQPRLTLTFEPTDDLTLFGGYGRGFRSGGFNQTGVGAAALAAGFLGVGDLFTDQVADTLELGLKSRLADGRVNLNFSVFDTQSDGGYFFVFLAESSTQNLGSLGEVEYRGYELDLTARVTDNLEMFVGYGATDSEITESVDPAHIGKEAPLVSENTLNVGAQYVRPIGGSGLELFVRADYQRIGDTYWEPVNYTVRDPVNLLDWRLGVRGESWSLIGWQRNSNDVRYNTEFSPGGFLFPAKPRRWGIDFTKEF